MPAGTVKRSIFLVLGGFVIFHFALTYSRVFSYSYDAQMHLYFSSHYLTDWLNIWDMGWYGGFQVTSYPPLTHQLTAMLGSIIGVEAGMGILLLASIGIYAYAIYRLFKTFVGADYSRYIPMLAIISPALLLMVHIFGQIPTVFATAVSVLALSYFSDYLKSGGRRNVILAALATAMVAASHHITFVFFLPIGVLMVYAMHVMRNKEDLTGTTKRLVKYALPSILLAIIPLAAFLSFLNAWPGQVEIPHGSRVDLFSSSTYSMPFFWGFYAFTAFLIPHAFAIAYRKRILIPVLAAFSLFFVLGLGGSTPLPWILFGNFANILTYDKFAFYAATLFLPFLAIMVKDSPFFLERYYENKFELVKQNKMIQVTFVGALVMSTVLVAGVAPLLRAPPESIADEASAFLNEGNNADWRYITLGFESEFMRLGRLTSASSIDGGYNTARTLSVLSTSGIERLDNAKYFPNGTFVLEHFLSNANTYSLRWVLSADHYYDDLLEKNGFQEFRTLRDSSVIVWEKPNIVPQVNEERDSPLWQVVTWSFSPVLLLIAFIVLTTNPLRPKS